MKKNQANKVKYVYFLLNKEVNNCSDGPYSWFGLKSVTLVGLLLTIYLKCRSGSISMDSKHLKREIVLCTPRG